MPQIAATKVKQLKSGIGGPLTRLEYAWVGYCLGLLIGIVLFGVLGIGRHYMSGSDGGPSRTISKLPEPSDDPRLKMIDELHSRYMADKITLNEFSEAKQKILDSIQNKPLER